jgi:hypothetical protein
MEQRLTALLSLRPLADGEVAVAIERSADGRHVTVDDTTLVLTLWHEGADVVRGRFDHPSSGAVAYFQSNDTLLAMANVLRVRLAP